MKVEITDNKQLPFIITGEVGPTFKTFTYRFTCDEFIEFHKTGMIAIGEYIDKTCLDKKGE